jgi:hypothetical protein
MAKRLLGIISYQYFLVRAHVLYQRLKVILMRYNLNNFSNIRLSLAVNTPSDAVTVEMETNENEVTLSTQEYI